MNVPPTAPPDQADELHATLANQYCRTVLAHFTNTDEDAATVDGLTTVVAGEHAVDRDEAAIALHHTALPKLDAAGIADYDVRSGTVRYYGHSALLAEDADPSERESDTATTT